MIPQQAAERFPLVDTWTDGIELELVTAQRRSDLRRVVAEGRKIDREAIDLGVFETDIKAWLAELEAMADGN